MRGERQAMKRFVVQIPITGYISIEVDADSEESAIETAWGSYSASGPDAFDEPEWEAVEQVCEGNVFHGMLNEHTAEEA